MNQQDIKVGMRVRVTGECLMECSWGKEGVVISFFPSCDVPPWETWNVVSFVDDDLVRTYWLAEELEPVEDTP